MRKLVATQTGVGASNWLPVDSNEAAFGIGFWCVVSGTVNYTIQHTFDDVLAGADDPAGAGYNGNYAPAWSNGVVYAAGAFVSNGGNVYQAQNAGTSGASAPTSIQKNVLSNDGAVNWMFVGKLPTAFNHTTVSGLTANADGNYAFPVKAVRVLVNSGAGSVTTTFLQGLKS